MTGMEPLGEALDRANGIQLDRDHPVRQVMPDLAVPGVVPQRITGRGKSIKRLLGKGGDIYECHGEQRYKLHRLETNPNALAPL